MKNNILQRRKIIYLSHEDIMNLFIDKDKKISFMKIYKLDKNTEIKNIYYNEERHAFGIVLINKKWPITHDGEIPSSINDVEYVRVMITNIDKKKNQNKINKSKINKLKFETGGMIDNNTLPYYNKSGPEWI